MRRIAFLCAVLALNLAACSARSSDATRSPVRGGRATITLDEIATIDAANAQDIVQRLRPSWLRPTAPQEQIAVFLDESQFGWVESLSQIQASMVVSIEYMDRGAVNARFTSERARTINSGIHVRTR